MRTRASLIKRRATTSERVVMVRGRRGVVVWWRALLRHLHRGGVEQREKEGEREKERKKANETLALAFALARIAMED